MRGLHELCTCVCVCVCVWVCTSIECVCVCVCVCVCKHVNSVASLICFAYSAYFLSPFPVLRYILCITIQCIKKRRSLVNVVCFIHASNDREQCSLFKYLPVEFGHE